MEKARGVNADALPFVDPAGAAIAFEGMGRGIAFDLTPEIVQPVKRADFFDAREGDFLADRGQGDRGGRGGRGGFCCTQRRDMPGCEGYKGGKTERRKTAHG